MIVAAAPTDLDSLASATSSWKCRGSASACCKWPACSACARSMPRPFSRRLPTKRFLTQTVAGLYHRASHWSPFARHVGRHLVAAFELAEGDVVAHRPQPRHDDPAALIDRQDLIGRPVRDEEARPAVRSALMTKPGENAATRGNRSPLARPSESAYDAPSEKPPSANRAGSTASRANTCSSARFRNATSSPNPSRMASHVVPRESGASTATPGLIRRRADAAQHPRAVLRRAVEEDQQRHRACRRAPTASGRRRRARRRPVRARRSRASSRRDPAAVRSAVRRCRTTCWSRPDRRRRTPPMPARIRRSRQSGDA